MKKFTKVLAAFCATAMVFGTFSATVFADETDIPQAATTGTAAREDAEAQTKYGDLPSADPEPDAAEGAVEGAGSANAGQAGAALPENIQPDDNYIPDENAPDNLNDDDKKSDEKAPADHKDDVKKDDDKKDDNTKAEKAKSEDDKTNTAKGQDAGSEPVVQPVDNPEEPVQYVPFADGNITQTDITANGGKMPETAGTYTLTGNVTVSAGAKIETQDASVTINLNGHTITYTGTESMYVVGKVRGTDGDSHNSNQQTAPIDFDNTFTGVTLTINGTGTITGAGTTGEGSKDYWINGKGVGTDKGRGGCVLIEWESSFILDGATITGFEAKDEGGAVCVSNGATFVMNSGSITNCSAGKGGGAISGHASSAAQGPNGENIKASVTINGGTISGNEAGQLGGGIRINRCHLYINGGEITNNNVKNTSGQNGGGGIEILHNKNGHEVLFKGSPNVYGNKANGNVDVERANIFLDDCTITLSGDLSASAKLGFSTKVLTANCFDINGKNYSLNSFVSDQVGYYAYVSGSYIKLKQGTLPSFDKARITVSEGIYFEVLVNPGTFADSVTVSYSYPYNKNGTDKSSSGEIALADAEAYGDEYLFKIPVISAAMTAPITVEINYDSDRKVTHDPFTIENYANTIIDGDIGGKGEVARALLIYGAYAQVKFGINTADPYHLPEGTGISDYTAAVDYGLTGAEYTDISAAGKTVFYGGTVSFESNTVVNLYFKKAELDAALGGATPTLNVKYDGSTTVGVAAEESGDYYIFRIKGTSGKGFYPGQYTDSFEFSFAGTEISGNYSVEAYLKNIVYKTSSLQNMKNLAQAYYNLATKA